MSSKDCSTIALKIRHAFSLGQPFTFPPLKGSDFGRVMELLKE